MFLGGLASRGPAVKLPADLFERPQRQVAQQKSGNQGHTQHKFHQRQGLGQPWLVDGAQKGGAHADVHGGEGRAVAFDWRRRHVINLRRAENLPHQREGIGVQKLLKARTRGQRLVFVFRIGAEQGDGMAVADVDVVDGERVAID